MTAYNSGEFIEEAIESVLHQQTNRTWELVLVDDGSLDRSLLLARKYSACFPHLIQVFTHAGGENRGISASRNLALRHARGQVVAFLDSDDVWLPHHLETQASLLEAMPGVAMVYGSAERWVNFDEPFDEHASRAASWGRNYVPPLVPAGETTGLQEKGQLLQWFLADESLVPCICSAMVRRDVALSVGGFCNDFRGLYDDQAFHAKISLMHTVYASDICVARYRQHEESCCARSRQMPETGQTEMRRFYALVKELIEEETNLQERYAPSSLACSQR